MKRIELIEKDPSEQHMNASVPPSPPFFAKASNGKPNQEDHFLNKNNINKLRSLSSVAFSEVGRPVELG